MRRNEANAVEARADGPDATGPVTGWAAAVGAEPGDGPERRLFDLGSDDSWEPPDDAPKAVLPPWMRPAEESAAVVSAEADPDPVATVEDFAALAAADVAAGVGAGVSFGLDASALDAPALDAPAFEVRRVGVQAVELPPAEAPATVRLSVKVPTAGPVWAPAAAPAHVAPATAGAPIPAQTGPTEVPPPSPPPQVAAPGSVPAQATRVPAHRAAASTTTTSLQPSSASAVSDVVDPAAAHLAPAPVPPLLTAAPPAPVPARAAAAPAPPRAAPARTAPAVPASRVLDHVVPAPHAPASLASVSLASVKRGPVPPAPVVPAPVASAPVAPAPVAPAPVAPAPVAPAPVPPAPVPLAHVARVPVAAVPVAARPVAPPPVAPPPVAPPPVAPPPVAPPPVAPPPVAPPPVAPPPVAAPPVAPAGRAGGPAGRAPAVPPPAVPAPVRRGPGPVPPAAPAPAPAARPTPPAQRPAKPVRHPDRGAAVPPKAPAKPILMPLAESRPERFAQTRDGAPRAPRPRVRYVAAALAVALAAGAGAYVLLDQPDVEPVVDGSAAAQARDWMLANAGASATVLAPAPSVVDLTDHGWDPTRLVGFHDGSSDPKLQGGCCTFLVVSSPTSATKPAEGLPASVRKLYERSRVVAKFERPGQRAEIRHVLGVGSAAEVSSSVKSERSILAAAGREIVANDRLRLSEAARRLLEAGDVDPRLQMALVDLTARHVLSIADFPSVPGEEGTGVPRRTAAIDTIDGSPVAPGGSTVGDIRAFLALQRAPNRADLVRTGELGGSTVLRVSFRAPTPLGMLASAR